MQQISTSTMNSILSKLPDYPENVAELMNKMNEVGPRIGIELPALVASGVLRVIDSMNDEQLVKAVSGPEGTDDCAVQMAKDLREFVESGREEVGSAIGLIKTLVTIKMMGLSIDGGEEEAEAQ